MIGLVSNLLSKGTPAIKVAKAKFLQGLRELLSEENLQNLTKDSTQKVITTAEGEQSLVFYVVQPEDNLVLKNSKLLLNMFSALEELNESLYNAQAMGIAVYSLTHIDLSLLSFWFKDLYEEFPRLFNLVKKGCLDSVSEGDLESAKEFREAIYISLNKSSVNEAKVSTQTSKQDQFLSYVKKAFATLEKLEQPKGAERNNNCSNWLMNLHSCIVNAVLESYAEDAEQSFKIDEKGYCEITEQDEIRPDIKNIKQVLNALNSLATAYHAWKFRKESPMVSNVAKLYAHVRGVAEAYRTFKPIFRELIQQGASKVKEFFTDIIRNMNEVMKELLFHVDYLTLTSGFKPDALLEIIKPVFEFYNDLTSIASIELAADDKYPFLAERIAALQSEKSLAGERSIKARKKQAGVNAIDEIIKKYGSADLSAYALEDLLVIKKNIKWCKQEDDIKNYREAIILEIEKKQTAKQESAATANQGYLQWFGGLAKQSVKMAATYTGYSEQGRANSEIVKEAIASKNEQKYAEFYEQSIYKYAEVLQKQQEQQERLLAVQYLQKPVSPTSNELSAEQERTRDIIPTPTINLSSDAQNDQTKTIIGTVESSLSRPKRTELSDSPKTKEDTKEASATPKVGITKKLISILVNLVKNSQTKNMKREARSKIDEVDLPGSANDGLANENGKEGRKYNSPNMLRRNIQTILKNKPNFSLSRDKMKDKGNEEARMKLNNEQDNKKTSKLNL